MYRRDYEFNYTNQWFKMVWFWFLMRIFVGIAVVAIFGIGLAITVIDPDLTSVYIYGVFAALAVAFVVCVLWFLSRLVTVLFGKTPAPRQPADWVQNPPGPWFNEKGEPTWERSGSGWRPVHATDLPPPLLPIPTRGGGPAQRIEPRF